MKKKNHDLADNCSLISSKRRMCNKAHKILKITIGSEFQYFPAESGKSQSNSISFHEHIWDYFNLLQS